MNDPFTSVISAWTDDKLDGTPIGTSAQVLEKILKNTISSLGVLI
jgi:hypothetical protein